jgi:hypothetical protein
LFKNIGPWLAEATAFVQGIEGKAESELTAIEAYTKANIVPIAEAVDGILTTAQSVTAEIDPAAVGAVTGLKDLFDSLINLLENGFAATPAPKSLAAGDGTTAKT